ncbi:MAG: glycosyltransferase family 39 protein [Clostridiales bacterium]|nr:glycosyltransferase family 39 protein [Clostridiales bacterium]
MNFWNGCRKTVYIILFAVLVPLSAYIFYGALDTLKYADALQEVLQGRMIPVFLLGTSVLLGLFLLGIFRRGADKLEKHWDRAVPALFGVMILLQVLMVLTVRTSLRYDHLKIFDTAAALLQNETIADTHFRNYFMKYPNNIPICLFTCVWLKAASVLGIPRDGWMELMKLVNLLFMNVGLWCTFRLVCRYRGRRTGLYFLLLTAVNPLWYLLGQMYYTSTISLAFSMGAVRLFDLAREQEKLWKKYMLYVLAGVLLAGGFKIRATVIITIAALLIYGMLQLKNISTSREAVSFLAVLAGMVLVFGAYGRLEDRYAGFDPAETGYPAVHWIMMSAQGEGQYNSADDAYTGSFSTREERTQADLSRLKERMQEMGGKGLLTLFRNKLRVAFSDGTDDYYSLFRTMRETSWIQKYVNGGRSDYLAVYLHSYHGMLTGLVLLAFVWRAFRRKRDFLDVLAFNICGAYLFYLIWEVDHAYSVPFMLMLLAWGADGLSLAEKAETRVRAGFPAVRFLMPAACTGILLVFAGVWAAVHRSGLPVREYAVLQDQESSQSLVLQTEFSQTFRTRKAFDHVDIWVANWDGPANDSVYDLQILDEGGTVVASGEITGAQAPCIDAYTVSFEKVVPDREQTYRLQIRLRNPDCARKTDFLYYQSGAWDMYGEGALYAPEEAPGVDLAFAVYEEIQ